MTIPTSSSLPSVDIFCRVIDNFGDAGVAWRLARRMHQLGWTTRLIIDNLETLAKLVPSLNPRMKIALIEEISIVEWATFESCAQFKNPCAFPSDLVIETFGCRLPESFEKLIDEQKKTWVNFDYLSAEDWVENCHMVAGRHPTLNTSKTWFFPGFTNKTGGVLIEDDYETKRLAFEEKRAAFFSSHHLDPQCFTLYFFSYPSADIEALAQSFLKDDRPLQVILAPGKASTALKKALQTMGEAASHIHLFDAPFVEQSQFDEFLWAADFLFIRGEDSFVRAQLAGKPLLWSIYLTPDDNAHEIKLDAWLERYQETFDNHDLGLAYLALSERWVNHQWQPNDWTWCRNHMDLLRLSAQKWKKSLLKRGDCAIRIADLLKKG